VICCDVCKRELAYGETVAVISGGEGGIEEILCESCDAAMMHFLQRLRKFYKDGPVVVDDVDKLLDTIAKRVDIPTE